MSKDRYPPFSIWGILFCFSSIIFLTQKDPCRSHFWERQRPSTTYDLIRSGEMGQRSHSTGSVSPFRFLTTPGVPDAAFSCSIRRRTASWCIRSHFSLLFGLLPEPPLCWGRHPSERQEQLFQQKTGRSLIIAQRSFSQMAAFTVIDKFIAEILQTHKKTPFPSWRTTKERVKNC